MFGNSPYTLADQQPNTKIAVRSDGHGGTDLVLVPVIGVHSEAHFLHQ